MYPGDDDAWNAFTQATLDMWVTYAGPDRDALRAIRPPALVVLGDRDAFIRVETAVETYRLLPLGELAICPVAGHDLPENHPVWLAELVSAFADRVASAGRRD
jgi:pimeloyl-ACP methyl ester carboxylesterase